jgi:hypothetical protein
MSSAGRTDPPTPTVPRSDPSAIPPHRLGGVHQVMHGDSLPSSWSDKVKKSRYFCSFSFFLGFRLRFFFPILKIFSRCGNFGRGNYCCTLRCGCKNVGWVLLPVGFFFFFFFVCRVCVVGPRGKPPHGGDLSTIPAFAEPKEYCFWQHELLTVLHYFIFSCVVSRCFLAS